MDELDSGFGKRQGTTHQGHPGAKSSVTETPKNRRPLGSGFSSTQPCFPRHVHTGIRQRCWGSPKSVKGSSTDFGKGRHEWEIFGYVATRLRAFIAVLRHQCFEHSEFAVWHADNGELLRTRRAVGLDYRHLSNVQQLDPIAASFKFIRFDREFRTSGEFDNNAVLSAKAVSHPIEPLRLVGVTKGFELVEQPGGVGRTVAHRKGFSTTSACHRGGERNSLRAPGDKQVPEVAVVLAGHELAGGMSESAALFNGSEQVDRFEFGAAAQK
jgi:hypothetical protein